MRFHDPERFLTPTRRPFEVAVGVVVGLVALLLLWIATYMISWVVANHRIFMNNLGGGKLEVLMGICLFLALGIPGAWVAYRLLSGRRRRDGGLLPPAILRVSGALLMVAPWFWVVAEPSDLWRWSHLVTLTSAGIACWILAARRERRDQVDTIVSTPSAKPVG
jgi:hypothetical protein